MAQQRNLSRPDEQVVPEEVVLRFREKLEWPTKDEGFDKVHSTVLLDPRDRAKLRVKFRLPK
ncbi:MAG: hypothetical protein GTN93_23140, partial [Anaerolineae bacterium]|nr:hypothetical protein [Anaerolineae bacterium]